MHTSYGCMHSTEFTMTTVQSSLWLQYTLSRTPAGLVRMRPPGVRKNLALGSGPGTRLGWRSYKLFCKMAHSQRVRTDVLSHFYRDIVCYSGPNSIPIWPRIGKTCHRRMQNKRNQRPRQQGIRVRRAVCSTRIWHWCMRFAEGLGMISGSKRCYLR